MRSGQVARARSPVRTMTDDAQPTGPFYRILVVDDDEPLRRIINLTLTREGHEVVVASDGAEGFRTARSSAFDLVITDLIMPDVEGTQLLRQLNAMATRPRVIAMSGGGRGIGPGLPECCSVSWRVGNPLKTVWQR